MADVVQATILNDGPRNHVVHLTNQSDGTGEAAVLKVDVSALEGAPSEVTLMKAKYTTSGMSVKILWDATTDVLACIIPQDQSGELCFEDIGGIKNTSGAGKTGDVNLTTVGHTAGDSYAITLYFKKKG